MGTKSGKALLLATLLLLVATASALAVTGQLTQLSGTDGCVSASGTGGECAIGRALQFPSSVAVSPGGENVYVASVPDSLNRAAAVVVFQRDATSGALAQLAGKPGCVVVGGLGGQCRLAKAINPPTSVAVSPDGKNVYVAARSDADSVAVFRRDLATGALTQLAGTAGCVSMTGTGGACADGKALKWPQSVVVSPDGNNVYVASLLSRAIAVFRREASTGELTQLPGAAGCISQTGSDFYDPATTCADGRAFDFPFGITVAADGKNVYVGAGGVAVFKRDAATGQLTQLSGKAGCVTETGSDPSDPATICTDGTAVKGAGWLAASLDGKSVYVSNGDAIAVFRRGPTSGVLTQLGCLSHTGSDGACRLSRIVNDVTSVAVSGDGASFYVASRIDDTVGVFRRDTANGTLARLPGTAGCVREVVSSGTCTDGKALDSPASLAVSPDGKNLYVASVNSSAVAVFAREALP